MHKRKRWGFRIEDNSIAFLCPWFVFWISDGDWEYQTDSRFWGILISWKPHVIGDPFLMWAHRKEWCMRRIPAEQLHLRPSLAF